MVHPSRLFVDIYVLLIFLQMHWGHMSKLNITYFLALIFKFFLSITLSGVYVIFQLVFNKSGLQAINCTSMSLNNELKAFNSTCYAILDSSRLYFDHG